MTPRHCQLAAMAGVTGMLAIPSTSFACGGSNGATGGFSLPNLFGGSGGGAGLGRVVESVFTSRPNSSNNGSADGNNTVSPSPSSPSRSRSGSRSGSRSRTPATTSIDSGSTGVPAPAANRPLRPITDDFWRREPPEPPPAIPRDDGSCDLESHRRIPIGRVLEFSVGLPFQSLAGNTMQWTGWSEHPVLSEQMESATSAPGSRLGLGRMNLVGATARVSAVVARYLTLALHGSVLTQANTNEVTRTSTPFRPARATGFEIGGEVGVLVPLGRVITARAGVFTGYRQLYSVVEGVGLAGCSSVPVLSSGQIEIVPRVQVSASLSNHVTVGAYAGVDVLRPTDVSGGLIVGFHGGAFAPSSAGPNAMAAP